MPESQPMAIVELEIADAVGRYAGGNHRIIRPSKTFGSDSDIKPRLPLAQLGRPDDYGAIVRRRRHALAVRRERYRSDPIRMSPECRLPLAWFGRPEDHGAIVRR
ncbi:hypothetical protein TruAng_010111 [Truncatella angustata]|nr:hypothetical protein TruAng_010111 [Truncatella angustata]